MDYFCDVHNMLDLTRIILITWYLLSNMFFSTPIIAEFIPFVFFLLWIKIFKYLQVFTAFRYLIMMIQAIVKDISTFLVILFLSMFAYGQIMLTMNEDRSWKDFRQGYVLAFGDLGEFANYSLIQFFMFIIFTFFIPLTLMNMLIAIMSDTYGRVQGSAMAADARALAEMALEMEQLLGYFRSVPSAYRYTFFTKAVTSEDTKEEEEETKVKPD